MQMDDSLKEISHEFFEMCPNLAVISQPFALSTISEEHRIRDLESEFELIRSITETKKHRMRLRSNTTLEIKKNRYPEQSIFDHSRVVILQANDEHGYINANYIPFLEPKHKIDHKIILTQGPIDNTINDFNQMIKQQNIECVVMLCRLMQNGKNRCADYLNNCQAKEIKKISDYISVKAINLGEQHENHTYQHVYYSEWPDKKVPSELSHILQLIKIIERCNRIVIHCSAGLGRSGVIAALLLIVRSKKFEQERKLSIFDAVRKMRQHRFGAVQNSQQYAFLYQFFKELHKKEQE